MATQKEAAAHIDINDRHLRRLQKLGVIPLSKGKGGLDLDQVRFAYILYLRSLSQTEKKADTTIEQEKRRLAKAKADKFEFEYKIMEGKYLEEEIVFKYLTSMFSNIRSKLLSLPSKASKEIQAYDDLEQIEEILERHIYETLNELKDYKKEDCQK